MDRGSNQGSKKPTNLERTPPAERLVATGSAQPPSPSEPTTAGMRHGFDIAKYFFLYAMGLPLLVIFWLGTAFALAACAGMTLVHAGTLEADALRGCSWIAIIVDGLLLLGVGVAWLLRLVPEEERPFPPGIYEKQPVFCSSLLLLAALGASVVFAAAVAAPLPRRIATVVVLANTYFFALLAVVWSLRALIDSMRAIQRWSLASSYRTGIATICLVLLGFTGLAARKREWYAATLETIRSDVNLEPLRNADGFIDFEQKALCTGAEEALETAGGETAPACLRTMYGGERATANAGDPACFDTLAKLIHKVRGQLKGRFGDANAQDAIMDSIIITCTRQPPPDNVESYFVRVAQRRSTRAQKKSQRDVAYDANYDGELGVETSLAGYGLPYDPPRWGTCTPAMSPEQRETQLAALWDEVQASVDSTTALVIRMRLMETRSFSQIGRELDIRESQARDLFHNAMKKFRRKSSSCD